MPVGKTKDAGWQIGVSRTLGSPVGEVWDLLTDDRGISLWLGAGAQLPTEPGQRYETEDGISGELRSRHEEDRVRLTWQPEGWDHDTTLQIAVEGKGEKTVVRFHQERLADADERERQRAHWGQVIDRLAAELS